MPDFIQQDEQLISTRGSHILYDASLITDPDEALFDLEKQSVAAVEQAEGRGHAVFFTHQGHDLVLKHYHRGGMVASLMGDRYLGSAPEKSRAFREWRLLSHMYSLSLPVPQPVAAHVAVHGIFHRGDLITMRLHDVAPLADCLLSSALEQDLWREIGACIRGFHDARIYHADLNARNILLNPQAGNVHLIDFDKGSIRQLGEGWKVSNLARLQRSLNKFKSMNTSFYYDEQSWQALLDGYHA